MPKKRQFRRNHTAEQKAVIVRRHLADKVPVSDLCDEYKIQPSVFYSWLRVALPRSIRTGVKS
ncbi:MAG: transposase [Proteobacteria bacterium]|nr:transposase [Pseudomonadota bacterium]